MNTKKKLTFASDYLVGAHEKVLARLVETNMEKTCGYGADEYCIDARERIREACQSPDAKCHFLVGGTQKNKTAIDALLPPYEGVIAAQSGNLRVHEEGAIEGTGQMVFEI